MHRKLLVFSAVAAALFGCGRGADRPSHVAQDAVKEAPPARQSTPSRWSEATHSPQPAHHDALLPPTIVALCGARDGALDVVAREVANRQARGLAPLDAPALGFRLRAAGAPHVWPRAWSLVGSRLPEDEITLRFERWLSAAPKRGAFRCGFGRSQSSSGDDVLAAVVVDALADLHPVPTQSRLGRWLIVEADLVVPIRHAKVVALGPRGAPRPVPTSLSGRRVRASVSVDAIGPWVLQVLGTTEIGPLPMLEARVFVETEPPTEYRSLPAPGENAGHGAPDAPSALARMVAAVRRADGLPALERRLDLDWVAQAHANRMRASGQLGHDLGDGDPRARLSRAHLDVELAGENVAHAKTLRRAHRALWASPSHRGNLLFPRYDSFGVGVARDSDGSLWVCEVFAAFG